MCGHRHYGHGFGRRGRRFPNREEWIQRLEERQRDLEQEIADLADVIKHLKSEAPEGTATV
jgi:ribosomal protein L19E